MARADRPGGLSHPAGFHGGGATGGAETSRGASHGAATAGATGAGDATAWFVRCISANDWLLRVNPRSQLRDARFHPRHAVPQNRPPDHQHHNQTNDQK